MLDENLLLEHRCHILTELNDFYDRLPGMAATDIIKEYQEKVSKLIAYIVELEEGYKFA